MMALLVYILFGQALVWHVLPDYRGTVKVWLGLVVGCVGLMWLPCLPAFFLGFTQTSQYIALAAAFLAAVALGIKPLGALFSKTLTPEKSALSHRDLVGLLLAALATVFCAYLLHTHVLCPQEDGSLWVGQSTYGDLAMHLGFVESLYQQGTFPPDYSIYPGQQLDYPFLVDAASASLRFFGLSLRMAVIVPSVVMLFCVFFGFWMVADTIVHKLAPQVMAWLLFVCNGGFGFCYFFGKYSFSTIFTGYYYTPTNLTADGENIRWVNVICDMLIPQRTTMAGWCVVLGAMYLLIHALRKTVAGQRAYREFGLLAVVAGAMPMIHTHSFLALGVLSAAWFFCALPGAKKSGQIKALVRGYVLYGAVCLALAAPQFFKWTMDSVSGGRMLQWNLGWIAGEQNWLWFYIVNCGVVFLAMWPMLFFLKGEKRGLFIGAAAIFVLANLVAFQPNLYDNNKLLYIWYMITDILVCDWLWSILETAPRRVLRTVCAAVLVFLGTFSGVLSQMREAVSGYQLLSGAQVEAAEFIEENTPPDSLFLTSTAHTNPVSVLTGRSIVCGSSLYLYFHGVDYTEREEQVAWMYQGGELFEQYAQELGVDYVYIGGSEYEKYAVNYDYFAENYPVIYQQDGITIFQIS
jgi:hypothetical protein